MISRMESVMENSERNDHGVLQPISLEDVWGVPADQLPDPEQRDHAPYESERHNNDANQPTA